jgi:hypothetical protein
MVPAVSSSDPERLKDLTLKNQHGFLEKASVPRRPTHFPGGKKKRFTQIAKGSR